MNRRDFLHYAGLAGASACLPRTLTRARTAPDISFPSGCDLPPVQVRADREIRTVVGLRPFRPSGFVVRAEKFGDTLVIHNYGHGGSGITLSWGTAKLAVDLGAPDYTGKVAVLGCGAVGLATARLLQESGFLVSIYSKAMPPNTTSNIAGGQWRPALLADHDKRTPEFQTQLSAALRFAYQRYQIMLGARYGVRWMRNYFLNHEPFDETGSLGYQGAMRAMQPELAQLTPEHHPFTGYPFVRQLDTLLIEPPIYLRAVLDDFMMAGGQLHIVDLADRAAVLGLPEKRVFNCTGLGARDLFGDTELMPMKGQLTFLLPQPEVQYAVEFDEHYMFPRSDGILLGGTYERGVESMEPNLDAKQRIVAAHKDFFDSFRIC